MPWYRFNGMAVHMRGRNLAKPCAAVVVMDGRRVRCAQISAWLCDWPMPNGRTCDAAVCMEHGWELAPNEHACPPHLEQLLQQGQGGLFTSLLELQ